MLRLFERITFVRLRDFGVALTLGNARHGKIHSHLGALAREVRSQSLHHLAIVHFAVAHVVLADKARSLDGSKLFRVANGAFGNAVLYDLTAYDTFFHK